MKSLSREDVRNKKILSGILTGVVGRVLILVAPFLVMPELLIYLGDKNFGIWMTAVSITSMAIFFDFGIGNGLLTYLSKAYGEGDRFAMSGYISNGYAALFFIALLLMSVLGLASYFNYDNYVLSKITDGDVNANRIILICFLSFCVGIPFSVIQRIMIACQENVYNNWWQIFGSFLAVVFCYFGVWSNLSQSAVVALYSFAPTFAMGLATVWFFLKNKDLAPKVKYFSFVCAKNLLGLGSRFLLLSIVTSIALNVDNIIIAKQLGASEVTEYSIPAKLASLLGLLITAIFLPLWGANGEALARKDFAWIKKSTLRMSLKGSISIALAGGVLVLCGEYIVNIWMHRSFSNLVEIISGLVVLSILFALTSPFQMLLNSAGVIGVQIKAWIFFLVISVLAKYFLLIEYRYVWIIPLISSVAYLFVVVPVVVKESSRIYNNVQER